MTFLVTGATGFIGRKLVAQLLAQGHSVNYVARERSRKLDSRAAFHIWDRDGEPQLAGLPRIDAVVHLAGEPIAQRWNDGVKRRIYNSRVDGTRSLVNAIANLKYKPSVLVSASAIGYYGDRADEVLTEYDKPGGDFLAQVCIDWEHAAHRAIEFGLRVVRVRIGAVLGRDGGALPRMLVPFKLGVGGRFGSGQQWMSWIHIDDLVRLLIFTAENQCASGPLNGSSPQPVTNAEFTKTLAQAVHRPALLPVPRLALRMTLGEMSQFLFSSLRVLPRATEQAGFRFQYPELKQALSHLVESHATLE